MSSRPTVAIIGTADTKLDALISIKSRVETKCNAILIDIGTYPPKDTKHVHFRLNPDKPDPSATKSSVAESTTKALIIKLRELHDSGEISGVIAAGGSNNTTVATTAMREALPIGFPKVMVSTMASGDVPHYVRDCDITMMYSVVDVSGINRILEHILGNAAKAVVGMALEYFPLSSVKKKREAIAVTMFGVTTPAVEMISARLEERGYEVVVFHATGSGGRAMERLIADGEFVGVIDLTTTELADELVGGVLSAGPDRLEAASKAGIPQVVSLGALDMVNFGPRSTVPPQFKNRLLYEHNSSVTLLRTTKEECAKLGKMIACKLKKGNPGKTKLMIPLRGLSLLDVEGGSFEDREADKALFDELRGTGLDCEIIEVDAAVNDKQFADAVVGELMKLLG